jgi:AN1-type zinc finger and ubiquitin domain-containing protein 1
MDKNNKCSYAECNKKLKLTDLSCRCCERFCLSHRLPETHNCIYDYKTPGKELLNKQNQPCVAKKMISI